KDQRSKVQQDPCSRSGGEKYEKEKEHRQEGPQPGAIEGGQVDQAWQRRVDERRQMVSVGEEASMDGEGEQFADRDPRGGRILNKARKTVTSDPHQQEWKERMQLFPRQAEQG